MIKMKKIFVGLMMVVAMVMLLNVSSAFAWYFDIRNPNQDYTVELYFTPDAGGNTVQNFNFAFGYDGDLVGGGMVPPPNAADPLGDTLDWSLETYTFDMPDFVEHSIGASNYPSEDVVNNFSGAGDGAGALTAETLVGTFTFAGTAVSDGYEDMWWARISIDHDAKIDGAVYNLVDHTSHFHDGGAGADVNPVPIPGAVLLLGSGLLGLVGIGRRRLSA